MEINVTVNEVFLRQLKERINTFYEFYQIAAVFMKFLHNVDAYAL